MGILSRSTLEARVEQLEALAASPRHSVNDAWHGCLSLDARHPEGGGVQGNSPKAFFRASAPPPVRFCPRTRVPVHSADCLSDDVRGRRRHRRGRVGECTAVAGLTQSAAT